MTCLIQGSIYSKKKKSFTSSRELVQLQNMFVVCAVSCPQYCMLHVYCLSKEQSLSYPVELTDSGFLCFSFNIQQFIKHTCSSFMNLLSSSSSSSSSLSSLHDTAVVGVAEEPARSLGTHIWGLGLTSGGCLGVLGWGDTGASFSLSPSSL